MKYKRCPDCGYLIKGSKEVCNYCGCHISQKRQSPIKHPAAMIVLALIILIIGIFESNIKILCVGAMVLILSIVQYIENKKNNNGKKPKLYF